MCSGDSDCDNTKICHSGVCGCVRWYGWQGQNCTEFGGPTYFLITTCAIQILVGAGISCIAIYLLLQYVRSSKSRNRKVQITAMALLFSSSLSLACWKLMTLLITVTPEGYNKNGRSNEYNKIHQLTTVERSFVVLAMLFVILLSLQVSLTWAKIAQCSKQLSTRLGGSLVLFIRTIYAVEVLWTLVLIIFIALGQTAILVLVGLPFVWFCMACYIGAGKRLSDVMTSVHESTGGDTCEAKHRRKYSVSGPSKYSGLAGEIRLTAFVASVGIIISSVGGIAYAILTLAVGQDKAMTPGSPVHGIVVVNEMVSSGILILLTIISHYFGFIVKSTAENQEPQRAGTLQYNASESFAETSMRLPSNLRFADSSPTLSRPHNAEIEIQLESPNMERRQLALA